MKRGEEFLVAGGKADAHARQVRALRQRLERDHVGEVGPGAFQRAARRLPGVDFRIALVAQDHEAVAVGELLQPGEIVARGDRALRIGGRGDEDRHRARQRRLVERVEIGQESVGDAWSADRPARNRRRARRRHRPDRTDWASGSPACPCAGRHNARRRSRRRTAPRGCRSAPEFRSRDRPAAAAGSGSTASSPPPGGTARCPWRAGSGRNRRYAWPAPGRQSPARGAAARQMIDVINGLAGLIGGQKFGRPQKRRTLGLPGSGGAAGALRHAGRGGHCHV